MWRMISFLLAWIREYALYLIVLLDVDFFVGKAIVENLHEGDSCQSVKEELHCRFTKRLDTKYARIGSHRG